MSSVAIETAAPKPSRKAARLDAASIDEPGEGEHRLPDLDLFRWLYHYTRPHAAKRNLLSLMVVIRAIQLPLLAWTMGAVINGPMAAGSLSGLAWGTVGFLALAASTHFVFHFRQRLALELGESVVHDLRNEVFAHLQSMSMQFFHTTKLGRIISRITSDAEAVRVGVQDVLFVGTVALGQMIVAAALMLRADAVLFLVVLAMVPVLAWVNRRFRRLLSKAYRDVQESFSRVTSTVAESIEGVRVIQGAVRQDTNAERFRDLVIDHAGYNLKTARTAGFFLPLLEFNTQFFLGALILVGGYRVLSPDVQMPLGNLVQFLFLANIFFQPIQSLGDQYNQALQAAAGAQRLRHLLSLAPEWSDLPGAKPREIQGLVRFDKVTFGYQPGRPILHDISFTVQPGQFVAVTGHTGCGKTTLVNLISRFYRPTDGRILIDGCDLGKFQSRSYHRQIGIVPQHNFLFSGTVLENIRYARPEATDRDIAEAIARLGCADLLQSLPCGLQTEVGEAGCGLSLGQRQLVCFARAMLADPRILLLDEATSSIDLFTEDRIQQAMARLLEGRTSFVVAHRLSTIRNADLVIRLDHGRIERIGPPDQVLGPDPSSPNSLGRPAISAAA